MKIEIELDDAMIRKYATGAANETIANLFGHNMHNGHVGAVAFKAVADQVRIAFAKVDLGAVVNASIEHKLLTLTDELVTEQLTAALKKHGKALIDALVAYAAAREQ